MSDIFMICWGETEMEGKKVVCFDVGGAMGNPALFCHSDDKDNCWSIGYDETGKLKDEIIGKFKRAISLTEE